MIKKTAIFVSASAGSNTEIPNESQEISLSSVMKGSTTLYDVIIEFGDASLLQEWELSALDEIPISHLKIQCMNILKKNDAGLENMESELKNDKGLEGLEMTNFELMTESEFKNKLINSKFGQSLFNRALMTTETMYNLLEAQKDGKFNAYIKILIEFRRECYAYLGAEDPNKLVIDKIYEDLNNDELKI